MTGTGTHDFEALIFGTTTPAHTISDSTINLHVVFENAYVMQFRGELVSNDALQGIWYSFRVVDPVGIEFDTER